MGNTTSSRRRRCGLCYFKLPKDTPFLDTPRARRLLLAYPTPDWKDGALDEILLPTEPGKSYHIKIPLIGLKASADRGCIGCAALWQVRTEQVERAKQTTDSVCLDHDCELHWIVPPNVISVSIKSLARSDWDYHEATHYIRIEFQGRDYYHPSAISISQALAVGYTGSKASLQTAIAWLVECESSHPGCTPPVVPLPYRILELHSGSNGQISARVLQDSGRVEPYACLSHRWGPSTPFCRTLKGNLTAHRKSVPWMKLPKTFQQAAMVTVRLGLKYLWIDSLCIVQDDSEDWKIQAAQMCDIYRGSRVTLSATNSTDSGDGLFRSVHKVELKPVGRKDKKVTMRISPSHSPDPRNRREASEYPLLTRGWVYQERLLSSRTIHFSIDELSFECRQLQVQCECGMNAAWDQDKVAYRDSLQVTDVVDVRNHWHFLVDNFCALNLTFHSDRLPALAGIARQFGTTHKETLGRYVAGFWAHTLLHDLLWYTTGAPLRQPPEARAAPSWSWAASPGGKGWPVYPKVTDDLQVVSFQVDLAGPDEYGPVKPGATLTLRGYLTPGSWKMVPETSIENAFSTRTVDYVHWAAKNEPTKTCPMRSDYLFSTERNEGYIQPGSTLYLLKTGFIAFIEVKCQMCLVLRPIDEGNSVYERVGMVLEAPQDDVDLWFRDAPAQVLTLE